MAPARSRPLAPIHSVRILGISATLSAVVHLIALTAASGLVDAPLGESAEKQLRATLVSVGPLEQPSALPTPAPNSPKPRQPARREPVASTRIVDPEAGSASVIIARAATSRPAVTQPGSEEARQEASTAPASTPDAQASAPEARPDAATMAAPSSASKSTIPPPQRILLEYELKSSIADGRARYLWTGDAATSRYLIEGSMEADGFFASMFAGRFEQSSEGRIEPGRLRPDRFSLRRGEAPAEIAHFDWNTRQILHQRVRGEHVQPLTDNAQDLQSFIFQFSHEFDRPVPPERVSFAITNARKLDNYEFRVIGRERLRLPLGEVETVHLVRITQEAGDAYEAWLSPTHQYLPVKIRFMLSGRFPVDQLATRINIEP